MTIRNAYETRLGHRKRRVQLEHLEARHLLAGDLSIQDDVFSARQNAPPVEFDVLANDEFTTDYDGAREISSVSFGSQGGRITISEDRQSIYYAPPADFSGKEQFSYFVDGRDFAEVSVSVRSPLNPDEFQVRPDGQWHRLNVLTNDPFWTDYEGERRITLTSINQANNELRIVDDGQAIEYRASELNSGVDQFIYIVDNLYSTRVTIEIPASLASDRYEILEDAAPRTLHVLANDFAEWPTYRGPREITATTNSPQNSGSTLEISADRRAVIYTPAEDFVGFDHFRYVVDGRFEATVPVQVISPVRGDHQELDINSSRFPIEVISNDRYYSSLRRTYVDAVDRVTSVDPQSEQGGLVQVVSPTAVAYTPPAGFEGSDTFQYVADGKYEATVHVNVTRPVRNDHLTVYQDLPNQFLPILNNDFLGNGYAGDRQITSVSDTHQSAEVSITGSPPHRHGLLYTPNDLYTGSDRLTYTVDDELTAVTHVNVRPLAEPDYITICSGEGQKHLLSVLTNDNFQHGYEGPTVITDVRGEEALGDISITNGGKHLRYSPSGRNHDTFTYTVDDRYESTVSVWLTNHLRRDTAVVDQNSDNTRIRVLDNDFEVEYGNCQSRHYVGSRRISSVSESEHGGTVTVGGNGRYINYTPPKDFYGTDTLTYVVDGFMDATVNVNVVRYVRDDQFRVRPGETTSLAVMTNDLFGGYQGGQQITAVTRSTNGATIEISPNGRQLQYTPAAGFEGTDTLTYTVDGALQAKLNVVVQSAETTLFPQFETLSDFQAFLIEDAQTRYEHLFGQPFYVYPFDGPEVDTLNRSGDTKVARDFSETNVQVEGIDEADLMEFDADHLYMLADNDLVILNAWPAEELQEISRTTIQGDVIGQFLNGDRMTVISQRIDYPMEMPPIGVRSAPIESDVRIWYPYEPEYSTIVTVLDVSDRTNPHLVQETTFEGRYVQTRAIGDYVYVALTNEAIAPEPEVITDDDGHSFYETAEQYLARVQNAVGAFIDEVLPNFDSVNSAGEIVRSGLIHEPEDIYKPISAEATNIVSLVSINALNDEPGLAGSSGVYTTGASKIYASHEHFFIFEDIYGYGSEDGDATKILQFDWNAGDGSVSFSATGRVAGRMLNQFSADEHEGHLRIATTISNSGSGNWSGLSENDLFVLRDNGGLLEFTGSLQNLALGEAIQSVRFMGPRAFLVTFREVDPLFGLDVSDPTAPEAMGHLTLPGFSSYMQPIDDNHLLTVGKNTPIGFRGPTQVSLFDVSDLTQPIMVDEYTFERFSYSEAEADHHAFGYYARHGLLAVPSIRSHLVRSDEDGDGYAEATTWITDHELAVLAIDTSATPGSNQAIRLVSEIAHDSPVRRSGYIGDKLYSIAENSVHVVDVANPRVVIATATNLKPEVTDPSDPMPVPFDPVPKLFSRAQSELAMQLQVDAGAVLPVTAEQSGQAWQTVVRVEDTYYRYEGTPEHLVLREEGFEFGHPGNQGPIHNPHSPLDVNADGEVSPNDATLIIGYLEANQDESVSQSVVRQIDAAPYYDTNGDGAVSPLDVLAVVRWLNTYTAINVDTGSLDEDNPASLNDIAAVEDFFSRTRSVAGDANLDGAFDSEDLVHIFIRGRYNTNEPATWGDGDWNGDGRFDSDDIVFAFIHGKYVHG